MITQFLPLSKEGLAQDNGLFLIGVRDFLYFCANLKSTLSTTAIILLITSSALAQTNGVKPQFWNNFGLNWNINEKLWQGNEVSYNFLVDQDLPWSEVAYYGKVEYEIFPFMQGISGLYLASKNQKRP